MNSIDKMVVSKHSEVLAHNHFILFFLFFDATSDLIDQ